MNGLSSDPQMGKLGFPQLALFENLLGQYCWRPRLSWEITVIIEDPVNLFEHRLDLRNKFNTPSEIRYLLRYLLYKSAIKPVIFGTSSEWTTVPSPKRQPSERNSKSPVYTMQDNYTLPHFASPWKRAEEVKGGWASSHAWFQPV